MVSDKVILDDGCYYVALNSNYPEDRAPGFLERRVHVPSGGFECVGAFALDVKGRWVASIRAGLSADDDAVALGVYADRRDAIVALWRGRHVAFSP